jgi:predicted alpha/beta hydrolase family esterase
MKTAIILHGKPSKKGYYNPDREAQSNSHWLPWVQHELLLVDCLAQAPELPEPYNPNYDNWKKVIERFDINEDTILIGHSRGAAFPVRYLSENKIKTNKVALIAPSIDIKDKQVENGFFDFEIDSEIPSRTKGVKVFYSTDDRGSVEETAELLRGKLKGAEFMEFSDKGHFTLGDMGTVEFSELKDFLIK